MPAGAGEDASPLGLRPVGAAEDGQNPTHAGRGDGRRGRSEFRGWMRLKKKERVNDARVEREEEMRELADARAIFIAGPRGSGASRSRVCDRGGQGQALLASLRGHVAGVGWEGSVRGGSLSPPDAASSSLRGSRCPRQRRRCRPIYDPRRRRGLGWAREDSLMAGCAVLCCDVPGLGFFLV